MMNTITNAAKAICAAIAALTLVLGLAITVAEPHIDNYLTERFAAIAPVTSGTVCTTIPKTGHFIGDGVPGEWATVEFRDVIRHRECGTPVVSAVVSNGGGIWHTSDLSIGGGVPLTVGTHTIRYNFSIDERVEAGPGRFRVYVTFPDAPGGGPPAISPWLSFNILSD